MKPEGKPIKEGKAKILYAKDDKTLLMKFKDTLTALDGLKRDQMPSKGKYNSVMSARLLQELARNGVPTHFVSLPEPGLMEVRRVEIIPVEVVCRNITMGSIVKRLPLKQGVKLKTPVIEFYLKNDALHDPWINEDHIALLNLATEKEMKEIKRLTLKANSVLSKFLSGRGLLVADFKLEFGRLDGGLVVADEITCDSMRILDSEAFSQGKLVEYDKQVFRDGGGPDAIKRAYDEAFRRIVGREPDF